MIPRSNASAGVRIVAMIFAVLLLPVPNMMAVYANEDDDEESESLLVPFKDAFARAKNLAAVVDEAVVIGFLKQGILNLNSTVTSLNLGSDDDDGDDSLVGKLNQAYSKTLKAADSVLSGDKKGSNDRIAQVVQELVEFIEEVEELDDEEIRPEEATALVSAAQNLIQGSSLRGVALLDRSASVDFTLLGQLREEFQIAFQDLRTAVAQLRAAGIEIQIQIVEAPSTALDSDPTIQVVILGVIFVVTAELSALYVTNRVNDLLTEETGQPMTQADWFMVFGVNSLIFNAFTLGLLVPPLRGIPQLAPAALLGLIPLNQITARILWDFYHIHEIQEILQEVLPEPVYNAFFDNLLSLGPPSVKFTISNTTSEVVPAGFQQMITFNPSLYTDLEATDLANLRFCIDPSCQTMLYAWLESFTGSAQANTATNAIVWVKLSSSIPSFGSTNMFMVFEPTTTTFDGNFWGEAPTLSPNYGQYDNGANVFSFYDNFQGASLDTTKWNTVGTGNGVYGVNNGLFVDSNGNSNENGVQVYTSQTFNGNYVYETYVGSYNQGTGFFCDCHLGLGFQVTPPSNAFVITMNGYAFWHYGFFNVYFISSPCCNAYSSTASLPPAPFIVSAIWTQGSQILLMDYTQILTWSDTLVSYSPNHFGIFSSSWRGDNSQTVNYARVRAEPPNNVMPSVSVVA